MTEGQDKIIILDFGGQYCHLIARRVRDFGVLAEVVPASITVAKIVQDHTIKGIIFSGGARSVYEKNAPTVEKKILTLGLPILGICYGHQLIAKLLGGKVVSGVSGEYGVTPLTLKKTSGIFAKLKPTTKVWMNHRDVVVGLPSSFTTLAKTEHSTIAAYGDLKRKIFGVQFHPEVSHTKQGGQILKNFVLTLCGSRPSRSARSVAETILQEATATIGNEKAIIGLSGGIDSTVAAALLEKTLGQSLTAVYVDTGLMRDRETEFIEETFQGRKLCLKIVKAEKQFFKALKGVTEPEKKRKIIGKLFADIFSTVARKEKAKFLIQGTIYSDRIESGLTKNSSKIKSHHNVGGLPKDLKLKVYEPLRNLYKDEVRALGKVLQLSLDITTRQVFPGPGLAIRIVGEVTPERVRIVRQAGRIIEEELRSTKFWKRIYMSFPVLLSIKSVGIQGDERSYKYPVVVRVIESPDVMTANVSELPFSILEKISTRITNEVAGVNRVVYDITHKPPATMEWE